MKKLFLIFLLAYVSLSCLGLLTAKKKLLLGLLGYKLGGRGSTYRNQGSNYSNVNINSNGGYGIGYGGGYRGGYGGGYGGGGYRGGYQGGCQGGF